MPKRLKILRDAGSTEAPKIWIEQTRRQAFSENVVSEHDASWLTDRLAETVPEGEFWFYFRDLSDNPLKDCNVILSRLGMAAALPVLRTGTPREGVSQSN